MYQIISMSGDILAETDSPVYSKYNTKNGAWIPANENDAECVVVGGKCFAIFGKAFFANSEKVVFVKKIDSAEKFNSLTKNFSNENLDIIEISQRLEASKNVSH